MKKQLLLIIDANSLVHRAFHALPQLTTPKGEIVNALYGFLLVLFKMLKEFRPMYIAACFDAPGPTKREEKFKAYKATRPKAPDELYRQIPLVKKFLEAFGIAVFEQEGFEADDLIGTIARKAAERQVYPPLNTIIVSGDMDVLQLVAENTKAYLMRKGIQDTVLYDSKGVEERFGGLEPDQLRDYKGLRGDPSDNIPGVTGVGEKTAISLLKTFGTLEHLYQSLKENTRAAGELKPKMREVLLQYEDQAFFSRDLATIDVSVPLPFTLKDLSWHDFDEGRARELLEQFEFRTLLARLPELSFRKQKAVFRAQKGADLGGEDMRERLQKLYTQAVFSKTIFELETRLTPVLQAMEKRGIRIEKAYFQELARELSGDLRKLEREIFRIGGKEFNVNSPRQLSDLLFHTLALSSKGLRKTPKGFLSTASGELEKLREAHPIITKVLQHRELAKLLNTYVFPLPRMADKKGRVHPHFDQLGAATGRISCSEPNLQNVPAQGEWAKKIRKGFVPEEQHLLASFDYSQMELRIFAHMAKEPKMKQVFEKGQDIHAATASEVFGVPLERVGEDLRFRAKALNFGILYGMGARGFAQSALVDIQEAQAFLEKYFLRFPRIPAYMEETISVAQKQGYVETLFGRKRYLPEINSSTPPIRAAAERAAVNHPIQGTAADIMKMAMVKIAEDFEEKREGARMLLQIHDELLFEIPHDILQESIPKIVRIMETAVSFSVPLPVEVKTGLNWGEMKSV